MKQNMQSQQGTSASLSTTLAPRDALMKLSWASVAVDPSVPGPINMSISQPCVSSYHIRHEPFPFVAPHSPCGGVDSHGGTKPCGTKVMSCATASNGAGEGEFRPGRSQEYNMAGTTSLLKTSHLCEPRMTRPRSLLASMPPRTACRLTADNSCHRLCTIATPATWCCALLCRALNTRISFHSKQSLASMRHLSRPGEVHFPHQPLPSQTGRELTEPHLPISSTCIQGGVDGA